MPGLHLNPLPTLALPAGQVAVEVEHLRATQEVGYKVSHPSQVFLVFQNYLTHMLRHPMSSGVLEVLGESLRIPANKN